MKMIPNKNDTLQMKTKNTQLQKELEALAREEETDCRFQHAKELQFRRKYEKYLTRGNFEVIHLM